MGTPAFRPGRERRFTSPELSAAFDSVFACPGTGWSQACGFAARADVNAAINIAAGHPTRLPSPLHARGGDGVTRPVNREPHLLLQSA